MKSAFNFAAVLLVALLAAGCQLFSRDHPMLHGQSPLKPASASPDSVAMEIIWARFPANDPVLVKKRPADWLLRSTPSARLPFDPLAEPPARAGQIGVIPQAREDPAMCAQHHHDSVAADAKSLSIGHQGMDEIASIVETYLVAERHLVAAVELAGGAEYIARNKAMTLAGIAPRLVSELYRLCRDQKLFEARNVQEQMAALRQAVKPGGIAGLKAAMGSVGRDCGEPRPPLLPLDAVAYQRLVAELDAIPALRTEPRGW